MRQYMLFCFHIDDNYDRGGLDDFSGFFNTMEEIKKYITDNHRCYYNYNIMDLNTGKIYIWEEMRENTIKDYSFIESDQKYIEMEEEDYMCK